MSEVKTFLNEYFPGLALKPGLYRQWPIHLHFPLGEGLHTMDERYRLNPAHFHQVYKEAETLFSALFAEEDEVLAAAIVHSEKKRRYDRYTPFFGRAVKEKAQRYRIRAETLPYMFEDEEEADEWETLRLSLACRTHEIDWRRLVRGACNRDFQLKPKLVGTGVSYAPDMFFINRTKRIIYYVYDDRGCEVIAADRESIRPLYERFLEWTDPHYKQEAERLFGR